MRKNTAARPLLRAASGKEQFRPTQLRGTYRGRQGLPCVRGEKLGFQRAYSCICGLGSPARRALRRQWPVVLVTQQNKTKHATWRRNIKYAPIKRNENIANDPEVCSATPRRALAAAAVISVSPASIARLLLAVRAVNGAPPSATP
jgi:hypothetical protein